eukprot:CAMPEP_0183329294 /NCGR_PEP_ID=MMETSP0160_2-20130417/84721_1 /TAXON_ID=2839 ORGANISM="Odontella Sinensis, Strain Grunow 1884" /NCGR_SAMPLE_ID=MMETSP0160_2 /ASSEMBLY_ACC=CAM_ASM_000250 /LENGTH=187 /DNA_ID=CAMNT_0025497483 /DNA_START=874 /DNA_END=1437 /DNA_ORIENTATION=-
MTASAISLSSAPIPKLVSQEWSRGNIMDCHSMALAAATVAAMHLDSDDDDEFSCRSGGSKEDEDSGLQVPFQPGRRISHSSAPVGGAVGTKQERADLDILDLARLYAGLPPKNDRMPRDIELERSVPVPSLIKIVATPAETALGLWDDAGGNCIDDISEDCKSDFIVDFPSFEDRALLRTSRQESVR